MTKQLGPIEICCDAPPYPVVRACSQLGFQTPEDVRWQRLSSLSGSGGAAREAAKPSFMQMLLASGSQQSHSCTCGREVRGLEAYTFVLISGKELSYLLSQCERCHTVYWDKL